MPRMLRMLFLLGLAATSTAWAQQDAATPEAVVGIAAAPQTLSRASDGAGSFLNRPLRAPHDVPVGASVVDGQPFAALYTAPSTCLAANFGAGCGVQSFQYPPESDSLGSAWKAAEIDPGILIIPDTSVAAAIVNFKPPANVDPKMILPYRSRHSISDDDRK